MNKPVDAESIIQQTSIENRAIKFKLHRGGIHKRVRDRNAEDLVKALNGDEGQIVTRDLFKSKASPVYTYQRVANEMYTYHVSATLPWGDDSSRLLPNAAYFDYMEKMNSFISELSQVRGQILDNWDDLVSEDITMRNNLLVAQGKDETASTEDYPSREQMESRLYVTWYPEPISTSGDFRFEVPQQMKDALDDQLREYASEAGRELYVRMLQPVSAFVDKLSKYNGDKGQRWHDSFVTNLNSLSTSLAPLNVNDDPVVANFIEQIDKIVKPFAFAPDVLKDNPSARESVRLKLSVLEQQLKDYAL